MVSSEHNVHHAIVLYLRLFPNLHLHLHLCLLTSPVHLSHVDIFIGVTHLGVASASTKP